MNTSRIQTGMCATMVALFIACADSPVAPTRLVSDAALFAKPPQCNATTNLSITMRDLASDAIRSDGAGSYQEGIDGVGAHLNGPTGNLMLNVQASATRRFAVTTTAFSGLSDDRLFTNTHTNPGGNDACGFAGMVPGSSGTAVLKAEFLAIRASLLRYGKDCSGAEVTANKATTLRSADGNSWTVTGTSGVHCQRKAQGNGYEQVGTAAGFQLTLVRMP